MNYENNEAYDEDNEIEENKHQRFKRLASSRTQKVLDSLRILGHCSNTASYEYTAEEVEKIFNTITENIEEIKNDFMSRFKKKKIFKL